MITENFDYKEFANKFTAKLPVLIPDDMNIEENDLNHIKDIVLEIIELASKAIAHDEDLNINLNQTTFFVQSIAEWTFYKTLDLINAQIPQNLWIRILNEIIFVMFKSLKNGINNDILEYKSKEEVKVSVEKKWNEILDEIFVGGVLSEEASKNYDFERMCEEIEETPIKPSELDYYFETGIKFDENHQYEEAIECYLKVIELNGNRYEKIMYQLLINCYQALDDSEKALSCFDKIIEAEPMDGFCFKGVYLYELKRYEEALIYIGMFENILKKEEIDIGDVEMNQIYQYMSECYKMFGYDENARIYASKIINTK